MRCLDLCFVLFWLMMLKEVCLLFDICWLLVVDGLFLLVVLWRLFRLLIDFRVFDVLLMRCLV